MQDYRTDNISQSEKSKDTKLKNPALHKQNQDYQMKRREAERKTIFISDSSDDSQGESDSENESEEEVIHLKVKDKGSKIKPQIKVKPGRPKVYATGSKKTRQEELEDQVKQMAEQMQKMQAKLSKAKKEAKVSKQDKEESAAPQAFNLRASQQIGSGLEDHIKRKILNF